MTVYEVVLQGKQGANDMLNVFHYDDGGTAPSSWSDVAAVFETHLLAHIAPLCGSRVTWEGITYRPDTPGAVGTFLPFPSGTAAGSKSTPEQMDATCMLVRKLTGGAVRPTRGWFMQGGISVAFTTANDLWETQAEDDVRDYANDIREINVAGPAILRMVIKAANPTAPNTQPYSTVATFQIESRPRVQRSRLAGTGS